MFPCIFSLPAHPLHQRTVERDSALSWAFLHASAAVPAFLGVEYYWRFALLRVWYENLHRTDVYAPVASIADSRVEQHRPAGTRQIRDSVSLLFNLLHDASLFILRYSLRNPL